MGLQHGTPVLHERGQIDASLGHVLQGKAATERAQIMSVDAVVGVCLGQNSDVRGVRALFAAVVKKGKAFVLRLGQKPVVRRHVAVHVAVEFFPGSGGGIRRPGHPWAVDGHVLVENLQYGFFLLRGGQVYGVEHQIETIGDKHIAVVLKYDGLGVEGQGSHAVFLMSRYGVLR